MIVTSFTIFIQKDLLLIKMEKNLNPYTLNFKIFCIKYSVALMTSENVSLYPQPKINYIFSPHLRLLFLIFIWQKFKVDLDDAHKGRISSD